jgi:hypothetical protein
MLTVEHYKNPMASQLCVQQYLDAPIAYQSTLFNALMEQGGMQKLDAHIAALHFYTPIFHMLCLCDNCPDREPEALALIRRHIIQFTKLYMIGGQP